jgi:hypothetical protein
MRTITNLNLTKQFLNNVAIYWVGNIADQVRSKVAMDSGVLCQKGI